MTTKFHRMEIYEGPDQKGRCHYALFWMAHHPGDRVAGIEAGEWRERGQHFFTELPGDVVDVRDMRGSR